MRKMKLLGIYKLHGTFLAFQEVRALCIVGGQAQSPRKEGFLVFFFLVPIHLLQREKWFGYEQSPSCKSVLSWEKSTKRKSKRQPAVRHFTIPFYLSSLSFSRSRSREVRRSSPSSRRERTRSPPKRPRFFIFIFSLLFSFCISWNHIILDVSVHYFQIFEWFFLTGEEASFKNSSSQVCRYSFNKFDGFTWAFSLIINALSLKWSIVEKEREAERRKRWFWREISESSGGEGCGEEKRRTNVERVRYFFQWGA